MLFGFSGHSDIVPKIYQDLSYKNKLKLFLNFYNSLIKEYQIRPSSVKNFNSIKSLFYYKANELLRVKRLKFIKCSKFCFDSNLLIYSFLNNKKLDQDFNSVNLQAAKFIRIFYTKFGLGVTFEAQTLFSNYIYEKISDKYKNEKVFIKDDIISLEIQNKRVFSVMAVFKDVNENYKDHLSCDIQTAFRYKMNSSENVYLACPRNRSFKRYIDLKDIDGVRSIRLVPYSICSKIF